MGHEGCGVVKEPKRRGAGRGEGQAKCSPHCEVSRVLREEDHWPSDRIMASVLEEPKRSPFPPGSISSSLGSAIDFEVLAKSLFSGPPFPPL